jgi:prevent-host-death family protein
VPHKGRSVGAYEAKTKLAELLDRVSRGKRITITRAGVPVAELVPFEKAIDRQEVRRTIEELRRFNKGRTLGGMSIRELIDEGRR